MTRNSKLTGRSALRIGLVDVDSHNFPSLPLMKLAAHHRTRGDSVSWAMPIDRYDVVYQSKTFTDTLDDPWVYQADQIIRGRPGYTNLPSVKFIVPVNQSALTFSFPQ
jgi:hypothetical protein